MSNKDDNTQRIIDDFMSDLKIDVEEISDTEWKVNPKDIRGQLEYYIKQKFFN